MGMGQVDVSPLLAEIRDVETEKGQDLVNVTIVDETEAVKFRQSRFGLAIFEIADPIVRDVESWIVLFFGNLLADLRDPPDGQVQSLTF